MEAVIGCDWLFWCLLFVSACMDCFAIVGLLFGWFNSVVWFSLGGLKC